VVSSAEKVVKEGRSRNRVSHWNLTVNLSSTSAHHSGSGYLKQDNTGTHDLCNHFVGSGMHNGGCKV